MHAEITKSEVSEAEDKLYSAMLTSDVEVLELLLHDDLIAVAPTGDIISKAMDLSSHRAKTMVIEDATREINEIKIFDNTAISVVTMHAKGKMMGTPLEGTFKYLRVWKRHDGILKVIAANIMQMEND